jgi:proteasome lid subunit RPN8/RPN11
MAYAKIAKQKGIKMRTTVQKKPMLRFSPTAWAKLLFMRDVTHNEVGGFGITKADDLLFVTDFILVKQKVSSITVAFEDESVANFFEDQVIARRKPQEFARIWLHTHPGDSPEPSITDENTFGRVFGSCDWSIMAIVAQDGSSYARLQFNTGPGGSIKIPVYIDYDCEFTGTEIEEWIQQYKANVFVDEIFTKKTEKAITEKQSTTDLPPIENSNSFSLLTSDDLIAELDKMDPIERQLFMDELAVRNDFWNDESEVLYG